jgi:hypothetical protein
MVHGRSWIDGASYSNFEIAHDEKIRQSPEELAPDLLSAVDDGQTILNRTICMQATAYFSTMSIE